MTSSQSLDGHEIIKEEYLPPSLQSNYISLLDIKVKALKKQLKGTEEQKIAIIKKRIRKFFDYGQIQDNQEGKSNKEKEKAYPPCEVSKEKIKENLKLKMNQLIVYGRQLNLQDVQKLLPSYICFEKINSCNFKFTFADQQTCRQLILEHLPQAFASQKDKLKYSTQIRWFDLSNKKKEEKVNQIFVRFATNKDDILLQNQVYFRKLLGKIRPYFESREEKFKQQEQEMQRKIEMRRYRNRKRKFISKPWAKSRQQDNQTVYQSSFQYMGRPNKSFSDHRNKFNYKNYDDPSYFNVSEKNSFFDNLQISAINHVPIDLEKNIPNKVISIVQEQKISKSNDQLPRFKPLKEQKSKQSFRQKLIKQYRKKITGPKQYAQKCLKSINTQDDIYIVTEEDHPRK